jgi:universal stress protein E
MRPIRRIAVATTLSAGSNVAIERAVQLAKAHGARLDLVHAFDVGAWHSLRAIFDLPRLAGEATPEAALREGLSELAASVSSDSGLAVDTHFGVGAPAAVIAPHLASTHAAVLVMARRSNPGTPGIGRTLKQILRCAPCPTLVVRPDGEREHERLLTAVDLRDVSLRAAEVAVVLFPNARHRLLCAIDPEWEHELWRARPGRPEFRQVLAELRERSARQLDALAQQLRQRHGGTTTVETEIVEAAPVAAIVDGAAEWQAHCVVVGRHAQGPFAEALLGSTALDAIHHTARDVLVVP